MVAVTDRAVGSTSDLLPLDVELLGVSPTWVVGEQAVSFRPLTLGSEWVTPISFVDDPNSPPTPDDAEGPRRETPEQPLGQAPVDNSQLFLRTATVLLQPGRWDCDCGIRYSLQDYKRIVILPSLPFIATERIRNRQILLPLAIRYGLWQDTQGFINAPVGVAFAEKQNPLTDEFNFTGGVGDVAFGVTRLLRQHDDYNPDVILTVTGTAPTGQSPYTGTQDYQAVMGRGFWGLGVTLGFVKPIDPAVLFGSIGYEHEFGQEYLGALLQPGENFRYQFGVGFAINDTLTVSSVFLGAFQTEFSLGGERVFGSINEPLALRLAVTSSVSPTLIVEPSVVFGLTDDAPAVDAAITITHRH